MTDPIPAIDRAVSASRRTAAFRSDGDGESTWLITLSDVMMLLLVSFILFYVLTEKGNKQTTDPQAPASPSATDRTVPVRPPASDEIGDRLRAVFSGLHLQEQASVSVMDREIVITLREGLAFPSGRADLLEGSREVLDGIARVILQHPGFTVEIDGHTDDRPIQTRIYASNWELSVARATSVLRYFIHHHQIDPSRFYVKGNADQRPLLPNDSGENRARNRRVEIRLKESGLR